MTIASPAWRRTLGRGWKFPHAIPQRAAAKTQQLRLAQIAQEKAQPVSLALRELPPLIYGDNHIYAMPFTGSGGYVVGTPITATSAIAG